MKTEKSELIYLDYHATTPVASEVMEAMLPFFSNTFGNPASRSHAFGWAASEAVELARTQVANLIGGTKDNVFFTSGSTESLNLAIKGLADARNSLGNHIIASATEHPAVLDTLKWLRRKNYEVSLLPVDRSGRIYPDQLKEAIRKDTIMVCIMMGNNETGVIHPIPELAQVCHRAGIPLICDATQAAGKITVDVEACGAVILCLSAHKMYGPKGVGAIYVHPELTRPLPTPLLHGGGHEGGLRSGTLNVPGIVGLGAAAQIALHRAEQELSRLSQLRDHLESRLVAGLEEVDINGQDAPRLPGVTNILVRYTESQAVMSRFRTKLAISSGSACSSADPQPSHVLLAMGLSPSEAKASLRISLGWPTTIAEIDEACDMIVAAVQAEREISPVWQMHKMGMDVTDW